MKSVSLPARTSASRGVSDVVALTTELLRIDSTTGQEAAAVDFVAEWFRARSWDVTLQAVEPGRENVWATRAGGGVTFSTHLDTVPPFVPSRCDGDRLYGRGACDAKGIAAAMMIAAQQLSEAGEDRVDVLFVVGEEKGSPGALAANTLPATSRFLVNGEPTESTLASAAKGALRVLLRVHGTEAHSAYAHLGRSALDPMLDLLRELHGIDLPSDDVLGSTTCNVGVVRVGTEANIVPGLAEAEIMIRLVGDIAPVKDAFTAWAGTRAELVWGSCIPAQRFQLLDGFPVAPVAYTSDAPLLGRWGAPLLFGPGSIHVAHTRDEYISVTELEASVHTYQRIARELLSKAPI